MGRAQASKRYPNLVVPPEVRRRARWLNIVTAVLGLPPVLSALYRDDLIFLMVYGLLYVLISIYLVIILSRYGFTLYFPQNSEGATQARRFTTLSMAFLVAANLYGLGATVALSRYFNAALNFGRVLSGILSTVLTCALSGIFGNLCYDILKKKLGLFGERPRK
jgi:hypothetical protein